MMVDPCHHEESWLLLPWLANGRLSHAERARLEEHLRGCAQCAQEAARQRLVCQALTEPDRVTYAPGPSFRKLMDRIDGRTTTTREERRPAYVRAFRSQAYAAWRPPGLAWAASFLLTTTLATIAATAYRWSQPVYTTYTAAAPSAPEVLHIAFVPSLSIAEAGNVLRAAGARVVEGPDATGVVGVTPVASDTSPDARAAVSAPLHTLAARLRADARVRWVEPLAETGAARPPQRPAPER
jgi:hypothetical protein